MKKILSAIYNSLKLKRDIANKLDLLCKNLDRLQNKITKINYRQSIIEEDICTLFRQTSIDNKDIAVDSYSLEKRIEHCEEFINGLEKIEIIDKELAN
jgi:hypothetical protein